MEYPLQPAVLAQVSTSAVVSGPHRHSHHHHYRPRQPHVEAVAPEYLLAPRVADPARAPEEASGSVDAGSQTMFRESEAQTDPFTPEVIINPNKPTPEVRPNSFIYSLCNV